MSDFVHFETNIAQELALAYDDGKLTETRFGDKVFYTLIDGRTLSVVPSVAAMISEKGIGRRQPFLMTRAEVRKPGAKKPSTEWRIEVKPQPAAPVERTPQPPVEMDMEQRLRASIQRADAKKETGASVPPPTPAALPTTKTAATSNSNNGHSNGSNSNGHANGLNGHSNGHAALPIERPKTKLEDALKTVVAACHAARIYAKEIGYEAMPQFVGEDLRAMAITILINENGGRK